MQVSGSEKKIAGRAAILFPVTQSHRENKTAELECVRNVFSVLYKQKEIKITFIRPRDIIARERGYPDYAPNQCFFDFYLLRFSMKNSKAERQH
jgi:hypothetical protein